jgi:DmsE family decaheme c-type cytochrome
VSAIAFIPGSEVEAGELGKPVVSAEAQAEYAGQDTCEVCHEDVVESFHAAVHGRADLPAWTGGNGCESCHGPASVHAESGDPDDMMSFAEMSGEDANGVCLECHTRDAGMFWRGGTHEANNLVCTSCHSMHEPWTNEAALTLWEADSARTPSAQPTEKQSWTITATCLGCHPEQQKSMYQRSNHPMKNGQISCADCHNPHGSPVEFSLKGMTKNENCYECHAETRGPFLWAHIPVQEDCTVCHTPHGSNQTKLLVEAPPRVCQSCHLFGHHQTVPGEPQQVWNSNRSCVNCHTRIHGSNHPSGILFMR